MDLSFVGESSKLMIHSRYQQDKENLTANELSSSLHNHSQADLLKSTLKSKEKERHSSKIQREISLKEDAIIELKQKCQELNAEVTKSKNEGIAATHQNKEMKRKVQSLQREIENIKSKSKIDIEKANHSKSQREKQLQEEVQQLKTEIQTIKTESEQLNRQNKLIIKRISLQKEEIQSQLQAKVSIKQKQLLKIQQVLESKKKDFSFIISEKDEQIEVLWEDKKQLLQEIEDLKQQLRNQGEKNLLLQEKTNQIQNYYEQEIASLATKNEELKQQMERQTKTSEQVIASITTQLKTFQTELELNINEYSSVVETIRSLKEEIKAKLNRQDQKQEISTLKSQVQRMRNLQLQLRNKNSILQQQLDFAKSNSSKNEGIASLIKQHLANHERTLLEQQNQIKIPDSVIMNKFSSKKQQNRQSPQNIQQQTQKSPKNSNKNSNFHQFHSIPRQYRSKSASKLNLTNKQILSHKRSNPIPHLLSAKINPMEENKSQNKENQFDFIKQELTEKKKSLIYLMYTVEPQKDAPHTETEKKKSNNNRLFSKQRSCSMGELVRRRCQQQIQG